MGEVLVGVDEAGVGPAFGSLWAAAVHLPVEHSIEGLRDSKKLSEKRRNKLREDVVQMAHIGYGEVTADEINAFGGMAEARRLVFERALDDYAARNAADLFPTRIIVDGTLFRPWRDVAYECVVRADDLYPCVSAASILAKTTRDDQVVAWCDANPSLDAHYGIRSNKGYLSKRHMDGLKQYGFSSLHRSCYSIKGL